MPARFRRCVRKVHRSNLNRYGYDRYNPYAVCRVSTRFYGPTKEERALVRGTKIEKLEHPQLTEKQAERIARQHLKKKKYPYDDYDNFVEMEDGTFYKR